MKKEIISLLLLASFCGACSSDKHTSANGIWTVDVRSAMEKESSFSMKEEVESIEYIPLETTDSCLISNTLSLIADDDYIFLYNGKTTQVFQFNRKGKFIRQIGRVGEGPGEYAPYSISELSLNSAQQEIYLSRRNLPALVYAYDGTFLRADTTYRESIGQRYPLNNGSWILTGTYFTSKQNAPWLLALGNNQNELIATKAVFPPPSPKIWYT